MRFKGERIFTPGPVELPDPVREALGRQIIHHRTPEFTQAFLETRNLFRKILSTEEGEVVFFASSGTGAMEACVSNFFREGEKVLVVVGGKFGERWFEISKRWGLETVVLEVEWGKSVDPQMVEDIVKSDGSIRGVLVQISESSTGAFHDVKTIGSFLKDTEVLLVADAITALGVYNINPQEWGIDLLVGGSQKAFMLPPGLSMVWISPKALEKLSPRSYYFDVEQEIKKQKEGQTAWTPAISHILALKESLNILLRVGMDKVEEKYRCISEGMKRAVEILGMEILPENPAISLTAVVPPNTIPADTIRRELLKEGIRVAGGQGKLKGRIFRISHMGMDFTDMVVVLSGLEIVLKRLGVDVEFGKSVGAFLEKVAV